MMLSIYFSLEELTFSSTGARLGIDNTPPPEIITNLTNLALYILDPLRELINMPIHVDSGYRCWPINAAVGGSKTSQHPEGKAADLIVPGLSVIDFNKIIKDAALNKGLPVDQLIREYDRWNHVSYNVGANRCQFLQIHTGTSYLPDPA